MIHWSLLGWQGAANLTENSRWRRWRCSLPRAVDSRTDSQVRMVKDHPQGPDLCGYHQENSWSFALLPPILRCRHSSRLASAESTTCNGHSLYRQPQSQTIYCHLELTPSALAALDDCRVTVRTYVRDFSGHLLHEKSSWFLCWWYFLGHTLNLRVTVSSLVMQAHAGSQVAR